MPWPVLLSLPLVALAQDPEPEPAPAEAEVAEAAEVAPADPAEAEVDDGVDAEDDDVDAEMTVFGDLAIKRASDDLIQKMESLGYRTKRDGDRIVFRPPLGWMGAAIFEGGQFRFRRSLAGLTGPDDSVNMELFRRLDPTTDPVEGYGLRVWLLPKAKKVEPLQAEVIEAIQPELSRYNAVVAATALQQKLFALPERLDAVWTSGTPLVGTAPLETPEARRRHVLEFWSSRASTPEGRQEARAVGDWLSAVVQTSDTPITDAERVEYERHRDDGLTLPE